MENKIIPIIIIGAIVIAILLVLVYLNVYEKPAPKFNTSSSINITYFNIMLDSNADTKINYILSNSTQMLMRGTITKGIIEEFKNIQENTTVNLTAYSDEYYYSTEICNITQNNQVCDIYLKKKALNFTVTINATELTIEPYNQYILSPIYCFSWHPDVVTVNMNLKIIDKPSGFEQLTDLCYKDNDVSNTTIYPLEIKMNPHYQTQGLLKVQVFSYEREGYKPIETKTAGMII